MALWVLPEHSYACIGTRNNASALQLWDLTSREPKEGVYFENSTSHFYGFKEELFVSKTYLESKENLYDAN